MKKNNSRPQKKSTSSGKSAPPRFSNQNRSSKGTGRAQVAPTKNENHIPRDWRIVIGTHAINEVLKVRPGKIKGMWIRQDWDRSTELRNIHDQAVYHKVKIEYKPDSVIEKFGPSQQGAAVFAEQLSGLDLASLDSHEKSLVLLLDGIEDPHNLGAIVRTAWLTGVHGVLIPEDRAVGLTPTVHKVACGGVEHVAIEETTNFSKYAEELKKKGYWIFGLSPRGKRSIFEVQLPEKVVWAIGAEDKGMRVTTERLCDELVFIPQSSESASYNASVATAMALTESLRQHATKTSGKKS